jgi:predicted ATPase
LAIGDERGSAVTEFVLVLLPFILLLAAQLSYFADQLERTQLRQVAVQASRYAALADVANADASARLTQLLSSYPGVIGSLEYSVESVVVRIRFSSHIWLAPTWSFQVASVAKRELNAQ